MKPIFYKNVVKTPIDVFANVHVAGDVGDIRIKSDGKFVVVELPLLRYIIHARSIARLYAALPGGLKELDRLLRLLDINLCLGSRKFVIMGEKANPLVLTAILAIVRLITRSHSKPHLT